MSEQHALLHTFVGKWKGHTTLYMGEHTVEAVADVTVESILGGNFVEMQYSADFPGMGPFQGKGLYGYSSNKSEFESVWVDSMASEVFIASGPPGKGMKKHVMEVFETRFDFKLNKNKDSRTTYEFNPKDPSVIVHENFSTVEGGKEVKDMRIVYKRV